MIQVDYPFLLTLKAGTELRVREWEAGGIHEHTYRIVKIGKKKAVIERLDWRRQKRDGHFHKGRWVSLEGLIQYFDPNGPGRREVLKVSTAHVKKKNSTAQEVSTEQVLDL
jgi:hypothetical protein